MAKKKKSALDNLLGNITKEMKLDKGVIRSEEGLPNIPRYSLTSLTLNKIFGPGFPKGRISLFSGKESSGKSLLSTIIASDVQKRHNGVVVYIDAEGTFDYKFANQLGLKTNPENFILIQPDYGEQGLQIMEQLVESGLVDLIIGDSIGAFMPKAMTEDDIEDAKMGVRARMWSKALPRIQNKCRKTGTSIILISQLRNKIGVMFGSPVTTEGGEAPKYYSSISMQFNKAEMLYNKSEDEPYALVMKLVNKKNKVAPPFKKGELKINFNGGIDYDYELLEYACAYNLIQKGGAWITFDDDHKFQGMDKAVEYFRTLDDEYKEDLRQKVIKIMFPEDNLKPSLNEEKKVLTRGKNKNIDKAIDDGKEKADNFYEIREDEKEEIDTTEEDIDLSLVGVDED